MDYCLEIKTNSDTFKTKSVIYSGNESSSEGKTTTIEDHITLVLHSLWILRNTTSHLTFKQSTRLNKTEYYETNTCKHKNSLITYFNKHEILQLAKTWKTVYLFEVRDYMARLHSVQVKQKIFHVDFWLFRYNTLTSRRKLGRSSGWPSKMNLSFILVASTLLTLRALRACLYAQQNTLNILSQEWLLSV